MVSIYVFLGRPVAGAHEPGRLLSSRTDKQ